MDAFEVVEPGLLITVQDRGRSGYQKYGVPVSGAVDDTALRLGNRLVGNPPDAAGLEMTAVGATLRFCGEHVVALTGAETAAELDSARVPSATSFRVRAGQVLAVGPCLRGLRCYLAIAGGIDVPVLLGSRATNLVARFGGFHGRGLAAGDVLAAGPAAAPAEELAGRTLPPRWRARFEPCLTLRVVLGPQADAFPAEGVESFLASTYRVTPQTDRMGCRLDGPAIAHRGAADILSDWIPPGAVQVPGNGKPIVLLADRQTTGGYTKIASVIAPDLARLAQCRPEDSVRFEAVTPEAAGAIVRQFEAALAALVLEGVGMDPWLELSRLGEVPGDIPVEPVGPAAGEGGEPRVPVRDAVRAPLPALVVRVLVTEGTEVAAGQPLLVLEAMKMEQQVLAPRSGRIQEVRVKAGDTPGAGALLVALAPQT
jgi:antagonist of KipI